MVDKDKAKEEKRRKEEALRLDKIREDDKRIERLAAKSRAKIAQEVEEARKKLAQREADEKKKKK